MDITKFKKAKQIIPCEIIKFDKSLIDGYTCLNFGCEDFTTIHDGQCNTCKANSKTPFIKINDVKYYITSKMGVNYNSTGFELDDIFYIILNRNNKLNTKVTFISEKTFKNTIQI